MIWIAPSEKDTGTAVLEKRLWDAADQFRANSGLKSPVPTEARFDYLLNRPEAENIGMMKSELRTLGTGPKTEVRQSPIDIRTLQELDRLEDEADQLVAITVASKKTARGGND